MLDQIITGITDWVVPGLLKIVVALIILGVSLKVIGVFFRRLERRFSDDEHFDPTITKTLLYAGKIAANTLVIICLIGFLGIETSGLSALIASLGVCAGLAVNGALSNLAGGVMIIITRPFKLGDYISALNYEGTVEAIEICYTRIVTVENKVVQLPNSELSAGTIVNYSQKGTRRLDIDVAFQYADLARVQQLLLELAACDERILTDPAPTARLTEVGCPQEMKLTYRVWVKSGDFLDVKFDLIEAIQKRFDAEGIGVPFEHMDINLHTEN